MAIFTRVRPQNHKTGIRSKPGLMPTNLKSCNTPETPILSLKIGGGSYHSECTKVKGRCENKMAFPYRNNAHLPNYFFRFYKNNMQVRT